MTPLLRTLAGMALGSVLSHLTALVAGAHPGSLAESPARKLRSRRSFTRNAALGAVGIVTAQIAGGFVYLLWPNKSGGFGGTFPVAAENVPEVGGAPYRFQEGKFYVVQTEDGVEALYWKCVHLGCTVPYIENRQEFICPCHGSVYDYNGSRISGPAARALDIMPITVNDDGSLSVDTNPNTVVERTVYTPEDAVPYPA
ncbi:MAG: Rieske 2Fe-2S domain-containing protein [Thermomicrobiales bacterium]